MRLGTLDLGSSSLHLWVVDLVDGERRTVHLERVGLRLVRRWAAAGPSLDPAVAEQALAAVQRLVDRCQELGCDHVQIAATAAVRDAHDHPAFCAQVHDSTDVAVRVLSGEDEARISFLGVVDRLDPSHGPAVMFDLGGGSTELVLGDAQGARWLTSLPLGHLRCTQAVAPLPDPPGAATTAALKALAHEALAPARAALAAREWGRLVGISGTVWTLSRVVEAHCGRPQPTGRAAPGLALGELVDLRRRLEQLPCAELADLAGMDRRRSDSFYAGAVLVEALLEALERPALWTAEGGVREGLVAEFERRSPVDSGLVQDVKAQ